MAQGWTADANADTVTFFEPPGAGVAISITQNPVGGKGGTDVWALGAWSAHFGYPSEVEFYADRLWFAGTPTDPQTLWASCIGDYNNFGRSSPIVDSDAVSFTNNSRQVNVITDLVPLDNLMVMTTGGEFKVTGGANEVVTPSTVGLKNQGNYGSGEVPARVIGESALFLQDEGSKLRDFRYSFEKDGFRGAEIGVWADHLFEGYAFSNIEYWKSPWSVVWLDRADGIRVGCTYMPEQEINGFHWHDTDGEWLNTCALPGKPETDCYYIARRIVDGEVVQYIERQAPTRYDDADDMFYVDSGLTYDGRNLTATTLTLTTATGWTEDDEIFVSSSVPLFVGSSDVGDAFILRRTVLDTDDDGQPVEREERVRVFIDSYIGSTSVTVHSVGTVPESLRGVPVSDWTFQRSTIGGLWHLEGKLVRVLQDQSVAGPYLVEDGKVQLSDPGGVVHVGLGYTGEIITLELNNPGGEAMRDMKKLTYEARLTVRGTRGVLCGPVNGPMDAIKDREDEPFGTPPYLRTGVRIIPISAGWGRDNGKVRVISPDPLPMEILGLAIKATASN